MVKSCLETMQLSYSFVSAETKIKKSSEKGFYYISNLLKPHLKYSAQSVIKHWATVVYSCYKQAKLLREGYGNVLTLAQNRLTP